MIFDFHTHYYPEKVAPRALENAAHIPEISIATDGTRDGLLQSMQRNGVDGALGLPLVTTPDNTRGVNRWAELNNHAPIYLTGSIHPEDPGAAAFVAQIAATGMRGIKVHPEYQSFRFSDRRFDAVWQAIADSGLFLITHAGADCGFPPPWHSNPEELADFHHRFPRLKLVLAHFGSWGMWDEVERHLIGKDVYLDTAFLAGHLAPERLLTLIRRHGAERVLFGTDSPWCDQGVALNYMRSVGLAEREWQQVMGENAARLLNL